ncbi:EAL domain-containing response regulator [Shewanella eurypsychrophilus]|uniref:EAL domain-containing response regulator n=1 Tax=Shewanella eurypsychrophilus TaxID=2593656 RepID=A0ABX6V2X8_9GAMM|nr:MULTISPECIES: EAL domain-containing response regulator [Shewanella]QFU21603.1 EAL domain-containing protein [Shewanella sp. YLB-09]QPG56893.1 EAL domain-containing response regulator [Shewanella eurypsychrophilus]
MSINVLVIDDSLAYCRVLSEHLMQLNVNRVEYCTDGASAVKILTRYAQDYQVVVVDLHMPNIDGIELLMQLNDIGYRGGVIIASAMESRIIEAASQVVINSKLRLLGALTKPVTTKQLKLCIERLFMMDPQLVKKPAPISLDELREALNNDRVIPYFQPQMDAVTGNVVGFEVLCRIQLGNQLQLLSPERFLELAESNQLIDELTDNLLEKAMSQWKIICQDDAYLDSSLSINLSPSQLTEMSWPNRLRKYCDDNQIDAAKLTIEITENQALSEQSQYSNISRLRLNDFGVAIDDFGTGYTNLTQLCCLPISELKLDMSFVRGIHHDPLAQTILQSLQDISRKLGIKLVAEGVEDLRDLNYLEKFENLRLQGYLICRPKPFSELIRWLKAHKKVGQTNTEAAIETSSEPNNVISAEFSQERLSNYTI